MTLTKEAKSELLATVVPHAGLEEDAVRLPNGMLKTRKGLLIKPAKRRSELDATTGQVTSTESSVPLVDTVQNKPVSSTRRKKVQEDVKLRVPDPVLVHVVVPGIGSLPSQYVHCIRGEGVLVLGMNKFSFMPQAATSDNKGINGVLKFDELPGSSWVYAGLNFKDTQGITNVLLIELPAEDVGGSADNSLQNNEDKEDDSWQ